jgi:hypothetical protein
MDYFEAKAILNENRKGKTFPRAVLEEARVEIRKKDSLGSVMSAAKR